MPTADGAGVCGCLRGAAVYFGGDSDVLAGAVDGASASLGTAGVPSSEGGRAGRRRGAPEDDGESHGTALAASSGSGTADRRAALASLTTSVSECSEGGTTAAGEPCSSKKVVEAIKAFRRLVEKDPPGPGAVGKAKKAPADPVLPTGATPDATAVRHVAKVLGCTSESCVVSHPKFMKFAVAEKHVESHEDLKVELHARFKPEGPRSSLDLLNNFNIDEVLRGWAVEFPGFFNFPFAMMDFAATGHPLARVDPSDILEGRVVQNLGKLRGGARRPCDVFACVLNTDVSSGRGKHWVAVVGDCRGKKDWSVEYFNSAGNPPPPAVVRWLEESAASLRNFRVDRSERFGEGGVKTVPLSDVRHQDSATECGLYALYFIRRRLEGAPVEEFRTRRIPDDAMTDFRAHVFRAS